MTNYRQLRRLAAVLAFGLISSSLTACADMDMPALATAGSFSRSSAAVGSLRLADYDAGFGSQIASYAGSHTSGGTGWCYQYVAQAIHAYTPVFLNGGHAYLAADQLAASGLFKEVAVAASDLPALPAGAVVVWAQGSSESGHISIADGRGYEISDHTAPQMTAHYGGGSHRVFIPALQLALKP